MKSAVNNIQRSIGGDCKNNTLSNNIKKKYLVGMEVFSKQLIMAAYFVFIIPIQIFAQLPNLGTAENFALFTSSGAVGNVGTSNITGNVGTNGGAISGFGAPTVVNGSEESVNSVTAQCTIDVQVAYNDLFGRIPTVTGHAVTFGNGETLIPGVYNTPIAGSLAGNLTLNAVGDPDAIFIFQFGGEFNATSSSVINLINGASVCNVFWIAEGAMSIAATTDLKGTFISNNGAISMGAGGTLEGRILTTGGSASLEGVVITIPVCNNVALSINLLSFTGQCDKQNIVIKWSTGSETNIDYFTVERSLNGDNWQIVGSVDGAGDSELPLNYTLTDPVDNAGTTYYRLKKTDFNGVSSYENPIVSWNCDELKTDSFQIYPNPSQGKFELLYNESENKINSIEIFNSRGQNIYRSSKAQSTIDLSGQLPGLYYLQIQQDSEVIYLKYTLTN